MLLKDSSVAWQVHEQGVPLTCLQIRMQDRLNCLLEKAFAFSCFATHS